MTHPHPHAAEIAAIWAKTRRAVWEYRHVPLTNRPIGPCIRCRAVTVRTHRGICRACLKGDR